MPYVTLQFTLFVALYFCNFGALSRGKTRMGRLNIELGDGISVVHILLYV